MPFRVRYLLTSAPVAVIVVLIFALPTEGLSAQITYPPGYEKAIPTQQAFDNKIDHIVIIMMENHAYDNYFGTYCLKRGTYCTMPADGIPKGTCVPMYPNNTSSPCITPFPLTPKNWTISAPLPHGQNDTIASINNGSMDGFYLAENSGVYPFGYYNGQSAAIYWDLAEEYGLGDYFFSSTPSYSLPNHWHLIAGTNPPEVQWRLITATKTAKTANRTTYLDEANQTQTIEDLLNGTSISWKYYDYKIGTNYSQAIGNLTQNGPNAQHSALGYWDPMAAKAESYNSYFSPHYVGNTQFFSDALSGHLPDISWVIPPGVDSDHPPASSRLAQEWLATAIDSVEDSPDWNHTAVFVTWDEYGGFYDHVAPPLALGTNATLGIRVPLLVISPYAKENYVGSSLGYFESLLRLVEDRYNLPCLQVTDCNAPSLLNFFYFKQPPRAPIIFPTTTGNASYPMPLQNITTFSTWPSVQFQPSSQFTYFPNGQGSEADYDGG